jgi:HEAT repeat protein
MTNRRSGQIPSPLWGGLGRGKALLVCLLSLASGCGGSSTDALIAQLRSADPKTRLAAARALADQGGDAADAVAGLADAAGDTNPAVRELAITTLGRIGPEAREALPALERALRDENSSVRTAAALAIDSINPSSQLHLPVLIESLRAGDGPVFLAVGQMGERGAWAVPTLKALLSDRRSSIRALAAKALGGIGPAAREAERGLQQCLRDDEPSVRKAAQNALRQIRVQQPRASQARSRSGLVDKRLVIGLAENLAATRPELRFLGKCKSY